MVLSPVYSDHSFGPVLVAKLVTVNLEIKRWLTVLLVRLFLRPHNSDLNLVLSKLTTYNYFTKNAYLFDLLGCGSLEAFPREARPIRLVALHMKKDRRHGARGMGEILRPVPKPLDALGCPWPLFFLELINSIGS